MLLVTSYDTNWYKIQPDWLIHVCRLCVPCNLLHVVVLKSFDRTFLQQPFLYSCDLLMYIRENRAVITVTTCKVIFKLSKKTFCKKAHMYTISSKLIRGACTCNCLYGNTELMQGVHVH